MQSVSFGDSPQLPRRHQAHAAPQQGDGKARIHQRHPGVAFKQNAAGGEHAGHPHRQAGQLHRLTTHRQAPDRAAAVVIDLHRPLLAGEQQQHRLTAVGPGGQQQPPNLFAQLGEALQRQLQQGAFTKLHRDRRQPPVGLIEGDTLEAQRMVDADLGSLEQLWLIGAALQQPQAGGVLLGATGRIALHRKVIEGQAHFTVAATVDQLQAATGGQELLQPMAPQGTPSGTEHQHHHAGMHQQRPNAPGQASAGRQPVTMGLDLPAAFA